MGGQSGTAGAPAQPNDDAPWLDYAKPSAPAAAPAEVNPFAKYAAQPMRVAGPGGVVVEFPAGTDPAIVDKVMRQNFSGAAPAQPNDDKPWLDYAPQPAAQPAGPNPFAKYVAPTPEAARAAYDALPWYGKAAQAADDTARLVANGATLGYGDKIAAGANTLLGGGDYASNLAIERAASQAAAERAGWAGTADSLAGMAAPAGAIGKGVAAIGDAASALPIVGRFFAGPIAQSAATGAGVGSVNATGNDQSAATGALVGAGAGAAGQIAANGATALASKAAGMFNAPVAVPTVDALTAARQAAYQASENAGVSLRPGATQPLADDIVSHMQSRQYDPTVDVGGQAILRNLSNFADVAPYAAPPSIFAPGYTPSPNPSLADLDALRQVAAKAGPSIGPGIVDKVTAFIDGLKPSDIVGGDLQGGVEALNNARALYAREAKGQAVADAIDRAGRNASKTAGGSLDAAMRSQANNLINSGTRWTPDEDAALRSIVSGTVPTNVLRAVGVLSPSTALGAAVGAGPAIGGALLGGPVGGAVGAAIPVAGFVAKKAGGAMTAGAMDNLGALTRLGGDASALTPSPNAVQAAAQSANAPLSGILTNATIGALQGRAAPDSRSADLAGLLAGRWQPPSQPQGVGAVFAQ